MYSRHAIAEILQNMVLKPNQSIN